MITQASSDEYLLWIWLLLQAASAGVFLHAGIKFPWFVFFQKDSGLRPTDPPVNMQISMVFFAVICIAIGIFPNVLYAMLPYSVDYEPYTAPHVITQLQLLLFSGLAFFVMLPLMKRTLTISLDFDWFYRRLAPLLTTLVFNNFCKGQEIINKIIHILKSKLSFGNKLNIRLSVGNSVGFIVFFFSILLFYFVVL
jgi:multicomponent Na+:H+ antiporter subunit D